jgi:hypothetical protein
MRSGLALLLLFGSVSSASAQSMTARPEDVATVDGIIRAFYDVISGPAGQPRQWQRDSTLYIPRVQFVAMSVEQGKPVANVMDHGQFARMYNGAFVDRGFFERETKRVTKRFGNIAHAFSAYEYRATENGPVLGRGVNSIQLYWDGTRWWIASAIWDDERPDNPIPAELR